MRSGRAKPNELETAAGQEFGQRRKQKGFAAATEAGSQGSTFTRHGEARGR
jgi:hypothetical protein